MPFCRFCHNAAHMVQTLADTHQVILIQDHWLDGFETVLVQQVFDNSNFHIKCVDDLDPILASQPPIGRAGTAILWIKHLHHCITALPDRSDRVLCSNYPLNDRWV